MLWQTSDKVEWRKGLYYILTKDLPKGFSLSSENEGVNLFLDVGEITTESKRRVVLGRVGSLHNNEKEIDVLILIDDEQWHKFKFKAFTQKETEEWVEKLI